MSEPESTALLAKWVSQGLEMVERSAKSHSHPHITRLSKPRVLVAKTKFEFEFRASPARANRRKFLPILYECGHIKGDLLEDDIRVKLGQYYIRFRASLQGAERSLGRIQAVLVEPGGDNRDQTDARVDDPIRMRKLKRLLLDLQEHIDDAIIFQKLTPHYREWQKGNLWINWLHGLVVIPVANLLTSIVARCCGRQSGSQPSTFPSRGPESEPSTPRPRGPSSEACPTTLADLYTVLSRELKCRCHLVHLGLCSAPVSPSISGSSSHVPGDQGSICSLFITLDLSTCMDRYASEDPLYLMVSRQISGSGSSTRTLPSIGHSTTCSRIITSPIGSKHCLQCETPARPEFVLESARHPVCLLPTDLSPNLPPRDPILTLHDILESHSQKQKQKRTIELRNEDRLRLAGTLTHWALQYYDTPWPRVLDTREIRFFTRHENDPNYANWTPYISASFTRTSPERPKYNSELCALGLVLLQLGLKKRPDYFPDNDWEQITKIASQSLPSTLGIKYTRIVEKLLIEGAKGDRMEGEQIDGLERDIRSKIDWILGFLSE